jgi:hypothetical protein
LPIKKSSSEITEYTCPKVLAIMIDLINKHALIETNPENRINHWTNNIKKIRYVYQHEVLDDAFYRDQNLEDRKAFKIVMSTIDKFELIMHRKRLEDLFETITSVGIGLSSAAVLKYLNLPWTVDIPSSIALKYATRRTDIGKDIGRYLAKKTEKMTRDEDSLYNLATASPGLFIRRREYL